MKSAYSTPTVGLAAFIGLLALVGCEIVTTSAYVRPTAAVALNCSAEKIQLDHHDESWTASGCGREVAFRCVDPSPCINCAPVECTRTRGGIDGTCPKGMAMVEGSAGVQPFCVEVTPRGGDPLWCEALGRRVWTRAERAWAHDHGFSTEGTLFRCAVSAGNET
jgi:hypothetical protein